MGQLKSTNTHRPASLEITLKSQNHPAIITFLVDLTGSKTQRTENQKPNNAGRCCPGKPAHQVDTRLTAKPNPPLQRIFKLPQSLQQLINAFSTSQTTPLQLLNIWSAFLPLHPTVSQVSVAFQKLDISSCIHRETIFTLTFLLLFCPLPSNI